MLQTLLSGRIFFTAYRSIQLIITKEKEKSYIFFEEFCKKA